MPNENPEVDPDEDFVDISEKVWRVMLAMLRECRMTHRISLQDLAVKIGTQSGHLSRLENRQCVPSVVLVMRWCHALGLDFGLLYLMARNVSEGKAKSGGD